MLLEAAGVRIEPERSELVAICRIDGLWHRAKLDNVPESTRRPILDLKSSAEVLTMDATRRRFANMGHGFQDAFYRAVWEGATGQGRGLIFGCVEKEGPFGARVFEIDGSSREIGERQVAAAREAFAECVRTGRWPGYEPVIERLDLPAWHAERWFEQEIRMAERPSSAALRRAYAMQAPQENP